MFIEVLVGLIGILIVIALWPVLKRPSSGPSAARGTSAARGKRHAKRSRSGLNAPAVRRCPVCHATLVPGERIRSVVFSGGTAHREIHEHTTHIFGCPHCYPNNQVHPRVCPVCDATLTRDGYLLARMFKRPGKKDHVHVLGCTDCRGPRSRRSAPRNVE
ncbi:MAG: hypothetical protein EA383_15430 [Spirochaetaceae bacterium]|nr:MAG: hypothetical protein EA383_15430 [Spirochaetaceae bacterium]